MIKQKRKMRRLQVKLMSVQSSVFPLAASALPLLSGCLACDPTNCIIVWRRRVAIVIDPGGDGMKIARFLKRNKLTVGEYWLTHAHPDHVGALPALLDDFPAPVRFHKDDAWLFRMPLVHLNSDKSKWLEPFGNIRLILCDDIVAKVIGTPGHTSGSVCYWFEDDGILLSGDTLVRRNVGDTNPLFGGNAERLESSLRKIIRRIPDGTMIYPGHGSLTSMGNERYSNPYLPANCRSSVKHCKMK